MRFYILKIAFTTWPKMYLLTKTRLQKLLLFLEVWCSVAFRTAKAAPLIDCSSHCSTCVDVPDECPPGTVFVIDGDPCSCCDDCVVQSGYGEACSTYVKVEPLHKTAKVVISLRLCQPGLQCIGGICNYRRYGGLCEPFFSGHPYQLKCDNQNNFLPVQCSFTHCWCVEPATGIAVKNTKVHIPVNYGHITTCSSLILAAKLSDPWIKQMKKISEISQEPRNGQVLQEATGTQRENLTHINSDMLGYVRLFEENTQQNLVHKVMYEKVETPLSHEVKKESNDRTFQQYQLSANQEPIETNPQVQEKKEFETFQNVNVNSAGNKSSSLEVEAPDKKHLNVEGNNAWQTHMKSMYQEQLPKNYPYGPFPNQNDVKETATKFTTLLQGTMDKLASPLEDMAAVNANTSGESMAQKLLELLKREPKAMEKMGTQWSDSNPETGHHKQLKDLPNIGSHEQQNLTNYYDLLRTVLHGPQQL